MLFLCYSRQVTRVVRSPDKANRFSSNDSRGLSKRDLVLHVHTTISLIARSTMEGLEPAKESPNQLSRGCDWLIVL